MALTLHLERLAPEGIISSEVRKIKIIIIRSSYIALCHTRGRLKALIISSTRFAELCLKYKFHSFTQNHVFLPRGKWLPVRAEMVLVIGALHIWQYRLHTPQGAEMVYGLK